MSYALSRLRFAGRKALMNLMLILGMFPGFLTMLLIYKVFSDLGLTLNMAPVGLIIVYLVDQRYLHFDTKAVWWAQVLKVAFGLLVVLAVKSGMKTPLEVLCGGHMIARGLRYFLIVIVAGIVWPLTFKWFSKLGRK